LRSLRRISGEEVARSVVRAQYAAGAVKEKPVAGYREEKNAKPDSQTETYVYLRVLIDNWRWTDVTL
jgi:glucose-6-phosphate 1-dehydrogenase